MDSSTCFFLTLGGLFLYLPFDVGPAVVVFLRVVERSQALRSPASLEIFSMVSAPFDFALLPEPHSLCFIPSRLPCIQLFSPVSSSAAPPFLFNVELLSRGSGSNCPRGRLFFFFRLFFGLRLSRRSNEPLFSAIILRDPFLGGHIMTPLFGLPSSRDKFV